MKKYWLILGVFVAGGIGYWLLSPLFIDVRVTEDIQDIMPEEGAPDMNVAEIASGNFVGLAGHNASGAAKLIRVGDAYYVRFEDDFQVTNGPDLFVYFGKNGQYASEARVAALKGNVGGQNYEVPFGINPEDYNELWIWCRAFAVPFGKAELSMK